MMNQKPYCTMKKEIIIFNFHGEDITIPEWCPLGESVNSKPLLSKSNTEGATPSSPAQLT